MDYQDQVDKFLSVIGELKSKKVAVIGHMRPDGDCIGSQVALVRGLKALGVEAVGLNKSIVPKFLESFIGDTPFASGNFSDYRNYIAITVDCSDMSRIGDELRSIFPNIKLSIDHHISNENYAENNIVEGAAAATCEILARIFINSKTPIDRVTAEALYLGIATDTGQFRYSATNAEVFSLCAKLVELGARPSETANRLYEQESLERILLLEKFLGTLKLELNGKLCTSGITQEMFQSTGTNKEHTEGFVDYPRSIQGVEIATLIEELADGNIKASLRAKEEKMRVDLLAKQFGGGGHACAAGFSVEETLDRFYPKFIEATKKHLEGLGK